MTEANIEVGMVVEETVGFCIYCGHRGTGTEHVIPLWAGGVVKLHNASCSTCERLINIGVESPMARGPFWSARLFMGLKSRRKHKDPLPVTLIEADGTERLVRVTREDNPAILSLCTFPGPHIYTDEVPTEQPKGTFTVNVATHVFDEEARLRFAAKHPSPYFSLSDIYVLPLARLMAKVAHGIAVLDHGHLAFNPLLRDFIRNGNSRVEASHFVGGRPAVLKTSGLHTVAWKWESIRGIDHLVYEIALFAFAEMPVYKVVVGTRPTWTTINEAKAVWGLGN